MNWRTSQVEKIMLKTCWKYLIKGWNEIDSIDLMVISMSSEQLFLKPTTLIIGIGMGHESHEILRP